MPTTTTTRNTTTNVTSSPHDPLDEPPPYTLRADPLQGETVVEFGPSRPYQPPPPRPEPTPALPSPPAQSAFFVAPQPTGRSTGGGLWRQLQTQIEQIASQIERQATGMSDRYTTSSNNTGSYSQSTYPGRSAMSSHNVPVTSNSSSTLYPPPRHPSSTSSRSLPEASSDFSRDFYAAGTGEGMLSVESDDNRILRNRPTTSGHSPDDRGPTTVPTPGRPLLHQGQLLVYPKGHMCHKCHNTGYKHYDPLHPCKKCWSKYAKPFSGPLVYSYSSTPSTGISNTQNTNLQRPLPLYISQPSSSRRAAPPQVPPRRASFSEYGNNPQCAYFVRGPTNATLSGWAPPPPGAVVFKPGDPRIGGMLCWLCHGKGTKSIFIDVINCPACDGCGRTFP